MMRKIFLSALALGVGVFLAAQTDSPRSGVVLKSVENMHSAADAGTDVVSQAVIGTSVKILKAEKNSKGEEWFRIETPDTYQGWMIGSSLRIYGPDEKPYGASGLTFEVTSLFGLIYSVDNVTKHKPLIMAPIGSLLEAGSCGERWCEITLPCGTKAWIQKGDGFVRESGFKRPRLSMEEIVTLARKFLGLPYYWGGTSPLGLDCSGFVQLVYRLGGIEILRDADIQFEKSGLAEVPPGSEDKGDLVFFGRAKDRISHVGMMVNREEFINATTHEKPVVQISRLKDPYWMKLYQGARRPI
jgi:hypothetical protein